MRKLLVIVSMTFLTAFTLFTGVSGTQAKDKGDGILEQANTLAEKHGFSVDKRVDITSLDKRLEFDSLAEFEEFLIKEKENNTEEVEVEVLNNSINVFDDGRYTLTYRAIDDNGFSVITAYARVERNSDKTIHNVFVSSQQTGAVNIMEYLMNGAWYTTHNANRNGTAYVDGVKHYRVSVGGIPAEYRIAKNFRIPF